MLHKDEYLNATEAYPTFGFEKALEDARDIAREQYTDDPDDPYWDEDYDDDPDRVVYVAEDGTPVTQRELDTLDQLAADYCARNNINIFN